MVRVSVISEEGEVHTAHGTNIVPGFPEGTKCVGFFIEGQYFRGKQTLVADGRDMVIPLSKIAEVIRRPSATPGPRAA